MSKDEIMLLADDLRRAFESRDIDAIKWLYSDDVIVWHNYDQIERTREQSLQSAQWVCEEMSEFSIDDCEIFPIEGGFIQKCVFRGVYRLSGNKMETHAMIRIYCEKGQVLRVEDYSDPAQGAVPDV
jgi:RimJ/RimL family protein N-acetyltransferase